jgi:8-oxo-dGTP pyrophosphatase MutT (NUDIX family)
MIRHFTSTGIVVHGDSILVHWHRKVCEWLAPGGHIEPNEDPVQATVREVKEETGFDVRLLPTSPPPDISNLEQIAPPFTVMVEDVFDEAHGPHQHIDFIYFVTPHGPAQTTLGRPPAPDGWHWIDRASLESGLRIEAPDGRMLAPPEDVVKLGIAAIETLARIDNAD